MKERYSVLEVLEIIKSQLYTIPVAGQHAVSMASALQNLDVLIKLHHSEETKAVSEDGNIPTQNNG